MKLKTSERIMWVCVGLGLEAVIILIFAHFHLGIFANCY